MGWTAAALIISSVVGLGGTVYSQEQQKSAQNKARRAQDDAEATARANEKKIRDNSAEIETAEGAIFGQDDDDGLGSYNDFLSPKETLGAKKSGLNVGTAKGGLTGAGGQASTGLGL